MGKISAKIWIESDELLPEIISQMLKCDPTSMQIKGEPKKSGKSHFNKHWWVKFFDELDNDKYDELRMSIFTFIKDRVRDFSSIGEKEGNLAYLSFCLKKSEYSMGLDFSLEDIELLCKARICFDVSVYSVE